MTTRSTGATESFREFYESVAENYPEEELVYQSLRGLVRKRFVVAKLQNFSGTLLDLGCNRGAYSALYSNGTVIGVDISKRVLGIARSRYPAIPFVQGDAQNVGFLKRESVDAILCSEMIEHVLEPDKVLSECHAVLRPGGKLLVTTPNYRKNRPSWVSVGAMSEYGINGVRGTDYYHTAFRPEELRELALAAGFRSANVGTFEKEVKYATRGPVLFYHVFDKLNKVTFKSDKVGRLNALCLEKASLFIYRCSCNLGLNDFFVKLVPEGVRSFLFATK